MPLVNIQINAEVIDDEETNIITVGVLVTASIILSRKSFSWLMNVEGNSTITSTILTAPFHVTNLVEKEEILMAFTAPVTPGLYKFTVCVRSDSYLGLEQLKYFKLDVKKAPEQPKNHPQYDFSSDEDEKREAPEFEYATDTDDNAVIDNSDDVSFTEDAEI
ncbi:hypothetical protein QYM36_006950 [Artemia franciscana]|uniref:Uncharacterized protein n=1 Tax=Artemia franciscana TaxID=6661 RepID=A0AA88LCR9_ARTSF|nr:hypothetical protein QYM36_006950 [Artemia franciscana]